MNQQIALRFIRALNFSASAVWNGKEALEYLLKATSPELTPEQSQAYPVPSLILMDVQMPVLDGYRATHMLRYHAPFTTIPTIAKIPVVAMTASAIQGDREKCERAGMDDYMAKPVKRSLLEQKILKWIFTGRGTGIGHPATDTATEPSKASFTRACTDHSSTCTEHDAILAEIFTRKTSQLREADGDGSNQGTEGRTGRGTARRSSLSQHILDRAVPGAETENDRATRRAQAEDTARDLRDAKLMHATTSGYGQGRAAPTVVVGGGVSFDTPTQHKSTSYTQGGQEGSGASRMALTEANVSMLNHAQDCERVCSRTPSPSGESDASEINDIPGPPPEGLLAARDLAGVDSNAEALVQALLQQAHAQHDHEPAVPSIESESDLTVHGSPRKTRRELGGLAPEQRQSSDWSTSTAKPPN